MIDTKDRVWWIIEEPPLKERGKRREKTDKRYDDPWRRDEKLGIHRTIRGRGKVGALKERRGSQG